MVDSTTSTRHPRRKGGKSRRRRASHNFASYLSFGTAETICIALFLSTYVLVLLILSPLLNQVAPTDTEIEKGEVLRPVFDKVKEGFRHRPQVVNVVASTIKKQLDKLRSENGVTDQKLIKQASDKVAAIRRNEQERDPSHQDNRNHPLEFTENKLNHVYNESTGLLVPGKRSGFMVLGMHRSGTSMLSGLLVIGMGYNVGGPLIRQGYDNSKGFFELIDAVLQNDEFMYLQHVWWAVNILYYNDTIALKHYRDRTATFHHGAKALAFLNNPKNAPYLQKDPRMCITLKTWLPLMNNEPAIVFTYRHPLEVAMSLHKREQSITLGHGLRIWIVYNMRAILNSANLCRVYSSNEAILADPLQEVNRISAELTTKCGVPPAPKILTQDVVDEFVDPSMQHKTGKHINDKTVIATYNDNCTVYDLQTDSEVGSTEYNSEMIFYLKAMQIYCDFKIGKAYADDYQWPSLTEMALNIK